ncbi:Integrase core domain-containing protein [Lentzea albidocapillata subsp. violacea]|uniref:Integrase core domain-containing protein n=1 Tax=Lentzea albidocapillata subsp. violacea TaxID=128104 RepID=A0A1G8QHJ7_9PSEU|nr:Integrase core domain-containing protein [Lentzea albidocapillata subsp. violacea]
MKTSGSNKPRRPRRAFTPEFKAGIVEQCQRGDRSIGQVAKDFDLTETAVVAESFFATIKTELLDRQPWPPKTKAHKAIFEYIEGWYNTRRRHSSLGYLSPAAYESTRYQPVDQVA